MGFQSESTEFAESGSDILPGLRFSRECRALLRQAGLGVWQLDLEKGVYWGDETTLRFLGIRSEGHEFRMEDVYARLTPEAPDLIGEKIAEAAREGLEEQTFEFGIVGDDGEPRWIRNHARNEFDESGRLIARYGTIRDITDEPRIQPWHPSRENRVTLAIRGAKAIPWEYDIENNTFIVDPINREDAGYPTGRPIAVANLLERIHPEDRDTVAKLIERQRRNPSSVLHFQYRIRDRNGNWRWVLARGEYRRSPDDAHGRVYGLNINVTHLKDAAFAPRRTGLSDSTGKARMGHWEIDLGASMIALSPDLASILGLDPLGPIPLEEIAQIIVPEDRTVLAQAISEGRNPDGRQGGEITLRARVGGETRTFRTSSVVTKDKDGTPISLIGVALDLTDLAREESRIRETRRDAEAAAALSTVFEWEFDLGTGTYHGSGRLKELLFGSEFEGCPIRELLEHLDPEKRWTLTRCLEGADHEATTRTAHTRLIRDDGVVFDLRTYAWTAEFEDGRPVRRQGIIQDVTRRTEVDDELQCRAEELDAKLTQRRSAAAKGCCWAWDYESDLTDLLPFSAPEGPLQSSDGSPIVFDARRKAIRLQPAGVHPEETEEPVEPTVSPDESVPAVRAWGILPESDDASGGDKRFEEMPPVVRAAYWELDKENDRLRGGSRLRAFFGLGGNERTVPRKTIDELVHPEDRSRTHRARRRVFSERLSEDEISFRCIIAGGVRHVWAYAHQEFDSEGQLVFQCGVFADVTERERVNAAVLQIASESSDERLEEFLRRMASALAEIVGADAVSVARRAEAPGRMQTLVLLEDGSARPNHEFDTCESVGAMLGRDDYRLVTRNALADPVFGSLKNRRGIVAYAAASTGDVEDENEIDVFVAFRHGVDDPESVERIVRLFATRIAANLKRHRAESRLRESEVLFRDMAENSIFAIRILQGDHYVYANSRYCELLDLRSEQIIGHRISEFVDGPTWDEIRYRLNRARMGIVETFDQCIRLKTGKEVWLKGYARPITYHGQPAFMAVFVDISDHKRLEEELRAAIERFTLGVKVGRMDFWEVNLRADVCVFTCNGRPEGAFPPGVCQFTVAEYISWIHPDDQSDVRDGYDPIINGTAKTYAAEYRLKTPACADWRWIAAVAEVVKWDANGRPLLLVGMQRDITEEKEAQERLAKQAEQLQHSQKMDAVGQLAGGVAHEFNNLLQVISGYGELLKDVVGNDPEAVEYLEALFGASNRGSELVRQLLQFSHKEAPRTAPVELHEVVGSMRNMLGRVLGENIRLDFVQEAPRIVIPADEGQLRQVLMNLCINARDAIGPRDGHIRIRLGRRAVGNEEARGLKLDPGEYAVLSIQDDGPGVPLEVQDKIFEPFFTTKEIGKGTGLGLSAVHGIVEHHRGAIRLESTPGEGATFHIYLPMRVESAEKRQSSDTLAATTGSRVIAPAATRMTALVAEDNPAVLELARTALGTLGIRVIPAEDGREAVARFREHRDEIDFLFFDVLMPKLSGPAAYERIREMGGNVPVIFASGHGDHAIDVHGHGVDSVVLSKPYSARTLQEAIEAILVAY